MKTGRPQGWLLDPESAHAVVQDVYKIDERGRIVVPTEPFGLKGDTTADLLGVLAESGRLKLVAWRDHGMAVVERRRLLEADGSEAAFALIATIDDRYRRLSIEGSGRLTIPRPVQFHLGWAREVLGTSYPNAIELWTAAYRTTRLAQLPPELADLP